MALTPRGRRTTNLSDAVGDEQVDIADESMAVTMAAVPTGASTASLQTTGNTSLATIATNTPALVSGRQPIDGSGVVQPISATALPLPTGAASAANQVSELTALASLVTNTTSIATAAKQDTAQTTLTVIAASLAAIAASLAASAGAAAVFPIAAGAAGPTVIKAGAGRLVSVLVTTLGAGVMIFYDNATTTSGTIIGVIPASAPVGTPVVFNFPAVNGITALGGVTMPAVSVAYL